jgi:hypothetical protein
VQARVEIGHHTEPREKRHVKDTFLRFAAMQLTNFEMEEVHNHICSAIYQNNVSPNQHVRAIRRR